MIRISYSIALGALLVITLGGPRALSPCWSTAPSTITIQGTLEASGGGPLTGVRDYRVRFYGSGSGGSILGEATGTLALSSTGRFSINLVPPQAALDADETWYELSVDAGGDGIDPNDVFPNRVRVHSVPFALRAVDSQSLAGQPASSYLTDVSLSTHAWGLDGNAGTSGKFLGTTDDLPLDLHVNGSSVLRLEPTLATANLIGGASSNSVDSPSSGATISGGGQSSRPNRVTGDFGTIGGGTGNQCGSFATVGGGSLNRATGENTVIAGGVANAAGGADASIGGGSGNSAQGFTSVVAGGVNNEARGDNSFVGSGNENVATGEKAVIGGGEYNRATGQYLPTIAGGLNNIASGKLSTVGGGGGNGIVGVRGNFSSGDWSTVSGGDSNSAAGSYSTVPGGLRNSASGTYSFATGRRAIAVHNGSFVWADSTDADFPSQGENTFNIRATGGIYGIMNNSNYGLRFENNGTGDGLRTYANTSNGNSYAALYAINAGSSPGLYASSSGGPAAYLEGNVIVTGSLTTSGGTYKIDHPLDPKNKSLQQYSVGSSELKNVYDGVTTLNSDGEAWVELPEWFEALNGDFRYQLTCVGKFQPVYIAQEISNNRFKIAGGDPGLKICWQVTGVRHDPYARNLPGTTVENKPAEKKGTYLHPEAYGFPPSKSEKASSAR